MQPASLFLSQLRPGGAIDSRTRTREEDIEQLAASIHALGLLQPIVVRSDLGSTDHEIVAGNRRFAAIQLLHSRGDWPADKLVDVRIASIGDTAAAMASMAENFSRTDMHPVETYEAFARLRDEFGMTAEAIAQTYALEPIIVERAMALGSMAPEIRQAWVEDNIDERTAKLLTMEPDLAEQAKLFARLCEDGSFPNYWAVQNALNLNADDATKLAFVGREAFDQAGGRFVEDLFGQTPRILDTDLLGRMARDKLDEAMASLKAKGWAWVRSLAGVENVWSFGRLQAEEALTAEQQAEIDALEARKAELEQLDELNDEEDAEVDGIDAKIGAIRSAAKTFTAEQMAESGCFVSIARDGSLVIDAGRTEPKATAAGRKAAETAAGKKAKSKAPGGIEISNALAQALSEQKTLAISRAVALNPHVALAALVATLEVSGDGDSPIKVSGKGFQAVDDRPGLYGMKKPKPFAERFAHHLQSPDTLLTRILGETLAKMVNVVTFNSAGTDESGDALVAALPPDQYVERAIEAFDPKRYFEGISGDGRAAALKAMGSTATLKGKKGDQVALCVEECKRLGWLPPQFGHTAQLPKPEKAAPASKAKAEKPTKAKAATKKPAPKAKAPTNKKAKAK